MLEADRQKTAFGFGEDWAVKFSELTEDDAFATFIQVFDSFKWYFCSNSNFFFFVANAYI